MEKEPTWQQLWNANTRLSTRLAEVERERDAITRQVKVLREALEWIATDHHNQALAWSGESGNRSNTSYHTNREAFARSALAALTSEGAAQ